MDHKLFVKPVSKRLLVPLIGGLFILMGGILLLTSYMHRQHLHEMSLMTEQDVLNDLQLVYEENSRFLKALTDTLVQSPAVQSALETGDSSRLLRDFRTLAENYQREHGLSHFYFHSADRNILLRVYKPETVGGRADRAVVRQAEKTGLAAAGLELGSLGTLTLRVVQPVYKTQILVGFVELGIEFPLLLQRLPVSQQVQLSVTLKKSFLQRDRWEEGMRWLGRSPNWSQFPDDVLVFTTFADFPDELITSVSENNQQHDQAATQLRLAHRDWRLMISPLRDASGQQVGDLLVIYDITSLNTTYRQVMATLLGGGGTLLLILCGVVCVLLQRADRGIREQQQALVESEAKYRVLFENSSVSILIHDSQGDIIDANQCALRTYGVSTVAELKKVDIFSEHSRRELDELLDELEVEGSQRFEWSSRNLRGDLFWEDVTLSKMRVAGHLRVVSSAIDITERKTAEAALQKKNEEMEHFVYVVSHDLKSPLITVKSFLDMLQQDVAENDSAMVERDISYIDGAVKKMELLLGALLTLSRVGRMENPPESTTFVELINSSLTALVGPLQQYQVDLDVQAQDIQLHGDLLKLGQIWQNLMENAIKYRQEEVPLRIEVGAEQRGKEIIFYVRDNGMGIEPHDLERVFVLFSQLNPDSDGSGLGLALVKKIIEQYQGRIWIESPGKLKGTCVYFTLPGAVAGSGRINA